MFKNEIPKDSLTYFINQYNSKVSNLKMELHPGTMNIRTPKNWQICDEIENQNPFTFAAFMLRMKEYDINVGQFEIVEMYHNTPLFNAPGILLNNFNYRKNLRQRRRYGPGEYLNVIFNCSYDCDYCACECFRHLLLQRLTLLSSVYQQVIKQVFAYSYRRFNW